MACTWPVDWQLPRKEKSNRTITGVKSEDEIPVHTSAPKVGEGFPEALTVEEVRELDPGDQVVVIYEGTKGDPGRRTYGCTVDSLGTKLLELTWQRLLNTSEKIHIRFEHSEWCLKGVPVTIRPPNSRESDSISQATEIYGQTNGYEVVEEETEEEVELTPKEIAVKLYTVMTKDHPMGSKKLARLAGLSYDPAILKILNTLRHAGKIKFRQGRWARA